MDIDIKKVIDDVGSGRAAILDVRENDEWQTGHIKGAIHYRLSRIEEGEVPALPKEMLIYTHCKSGGRATRAKEALVNAGFQNVVCVGGYVNWKEAGGPVVE